jgi:hypothetical protein
MSKYLYKIKEKECPTIIRSDKPHERIKKGKTSQFGRLHGLTVSFISIFLSPREEGMRDSN